ncbi:MAG: hypothetical protein AB8H47_18750 [Bacteroidia bacterium]
MMVKKIAFVLIAILMFLMILGVGGIKYLESNWFKERPQYLSYTHDTKPIAFCWSSGNYGDYTEAHNAILVPVKLGNFSQKFYLQFDTGAPTTIIYGNTLQSLKEHGLAFNEVVKDDRAMIEKLDMKLGGNQISASSITIRKGYGQSFQLNDTISDISLGTIGADFINEQITAIDFKNKFIQLYDERPDWMASLADFQAFDFSGRRMMLPAKIGEEQLTLLYDSGSSAFGLITNLSRYKNYSDDDREEIRYSANNMGRQIPICHKSTDRMIAIGNADLPLTRISYVDMYAKLQKFVSPFSKVGGWLGNKPFLENAIIFDTKAAEFLVIESTEMR